MGFKIRWKYLFPLLWIIIVSVWLAFIIGDLKYPHFDMLAILFLAIPSILLIIIFSVNKIERKIVKNICSVILIFAFVFSLGYSVLILRILPFAISSKTEDPKNYLITDLSEIDDFSYYMPEKIPKSATNIKYSYALESDPAWYIYAYWNLPDDEYNAEKLRISKIAGEYGLQIKSTGDILSYSQAESFGVDDGTFINFNDNDKSVEYIYSSSISIESINTNLTG